MRGIFIATGVICFFLVSVIIQTSAAQDVISGCYSQRDGKLRIVSDSSECKKAEDFIQWNVQGVQGEPGIDGEDGINCWDLNGNGDCDFETEDITGDGLCDAYDCQGPEGAPGTLDTDTALALCELMALNNIIPPDSLSCPELKQKLVFVTSGTFSGDLITEAQNQAGYTYNKGVEAADALCQQLADDAGLTGKYKAWISDGYTAPANSFTQSAAGYLRTDGGVVASNWTDLTDGSITLPITVDENGNDITETGNYVWSNVLPNGYPESSDTSAHCNSWARNWTGHGYTGLYHETNAEWTDSQYPAGCSSIIRLYCFQQ